jgi:hypothetical protein
MLTRLASTSGKLELRAPGNKLNLLMAAVKTWNGAYKRRAKKID